MKTGNVAKAKKLDALEGIGKHILKIFKEVKMPLRRGAYLKWVKDCSERDELLWRRIIKETDLVKFSL